MRESIPFNMQVAMEIWKWNDGILLERQFMILAILIINKLCTVLLFKETFLWDFFVIIRNLHQIYWEEMETLKLKVSFFVMISKTLHKKKDLPFDRIYHIILDSNIWKLTRQTLLQCVTFGEPSFNQMILSSSTFKVKHKQKT